MIRYTFTGHLFPKPAGTERAMCQLTGEVFLAAEVEAWKAQTERAQAQEITRLNARLSKALDANQRLKKRLRVGKSGDAK